MIAVAAAGGGTDATLPFFADLAAVATDAGGGCEPRAARSEPSGGLLLATPFLPPPLLPVLPAPASVADALPFAADALRPAADTLALPPFAVCAFAPDALTPAGGAELRRAPWLSAPLALEAFFPAPFLPPAAGFTLLRLGATLALALRWKPEGLRPALLAGGR